VVPDPQARAELKALDIADVRVTNSDTSRDATVEFAEEKRPRVAFMGPRRHG